MKKVLLVLIVGILVLSGLGAVATSETKMSEEIFEIKQTLSFKEPIIDDIGEYVTVNLPDSSARLRQPGAPDLPMNVLVYYLPFGVENVEVKFTPLDICEQVISKDVIPASEPVPLIYGKTIESKIEKAKELYSSIYPDVWYGVRVGCGLNPENNVRSTIVSVQVFTQYSGTDHKLFSIKNAELEITYKMGKNSVTSADEYDMVVIAPEEFSFALQRLIKHKEKFGVKTILQTVEDIYNEYDGFDKPEEIKLFIKDAIEQWNITYVLLVGGLNNYDDAEDRDNRNEGTTFWHVPVRYTNLYDDDYPTVYDPGAISDHYYADVYKEGSVFEDWDSNDDGIFAAWDCPGKADDELDLYPDVYVGRLACRNKFEVLYMVHKIVIYEKISARSGWFNRMVCIAGDSFPGYGAEGENTCNAMLEYMTDFDPVKVYASNRDTGEGKTPTNTNITRTAISGSGFLSFEGHGNPAVWATKWPGGNEWVDKYDLFNFTKWFNLRRLPVCVVGGCHNSQINVTRNKTENGPDIGGYWTHGLAIPECWSWWMTRKIFGGSIATIGMTALGYGVVGPSDPIGLGAYMDLLFFWAYGEEEEHVLGDACGAALTRYVSEIPTDPLHDEKVDTKTVQSWLLLGDPSLMIGGYE